MSGTPNSVPLPFTLSSLLDHPLRLHGLTPSLKCKLYESMYINIERKVTFLPLMNIVFSLSIANIHLLAFTPSFPTRTSAMALGCRLYNNRKYTTFT